MSNLFNVEVELDPNNTHEEEWEQGDNITF
jgi:hypothetical protein